jgi:hypothetical protein
VREAIDADDGELCLPAVEDQGLQNTAADAFNTLNSFKPLQGIFSLLGSEVVELLVAVGRDVHVQLLSHEAGFLVL